jgi:hypothetical protein
VGRHAAVEVRDAVGVVDVGGRRGEQVPAVEGAARQFVVLVLDRPDVESAGEARAVGTATPLSGATIRWSPASTTTAARSVPTPGSTTTQWVAGGKYGSTSRSQNAAARTSWRGKSWATSSIRAPEREQITPRIAAGYGLGKSEASVIIPVRRAIPRLTLPVRLPDGRSLPAILTFFPRKVGTWRR